jgi:hypothetical protein
MLTSANLAKLRRDAMRALNLGKKVKLKVGILCSHGRSGVGGMFPDVQVSTGSRTKGMVLERHV